MKGDVSTSAAGEHDLVLSAVKARGEVSASPVRCDDGTKGVGPEEFRQGLQVCSEQDLAVDGYQKQENKSDLKSTH